MITIVLIWAGYAFLPSTLNLKPEFRELNQIRTSKNIYNNQSQYLRQMYEWQKAFQSRNFSSNGEISVSIFGKQLSEIERRMDNIYPFLNMRTLLDYIDWDWLWIRNRKKLDDFANSIRDGDTVFVRTRFIET